MPELGRVILAGAGPGDPGLITLRGAEALRQAQAVVYDHLASPELLRLAPPEAQRIYVGKVAGRHTMEQEEINGLLIRLARSGTRVVRLKGGDPFVFGRGGEEARALVEAGIPFEVVPGVTSAVAAPAYAGIPVTHRGLASSVALVTGHEDPSKPESAIDWDALAGIDTLVFLMGVGNLTAISGELVGRGRRPNTPVALIEWGTLGTQRTVTGTLADIAGRAQEAGLQSPAVIVVGQVVSLRERLRWFDLRPLHGLRVLVTRTREQAGRLAAALREAGAEPVECPLIETVPPMDWAPLDRAIGGLAAYQWVAFTSANGVEAFFSRVSLAGLDSRALAGVRIAAIGPATAGALAAHGLRADVVPEEYVAEALAEAMGDVEGLRVLLPRADIARPALVEELRARGAEVDEVIAYRTVSPEGLTKRLEGALLESDVVTFTSSSTVRSFVEALEPQVRETALSEVVAAAIGPITAQTARDLGLRPAVVASEYTIEGLVRALIEWRRGSQKGTVTTA